jgi:hypothetical protein
MLWTLLQPSMRKDVGRPTNIYLYILYFIFYIFILNMFYNHLHWLKK